MKILLIILSLLSVSSYAQEKEQPVNLKNEIGLSTGVTINLTSTAPFSSRPGDRLTLGYLRNIDRVQVGLAAETGSNGDGYRYIAPIITFNYCMPAGKSYAYVGMAGGYYYQQFVSLGMRNGYGSQGYTVGMQAGYVWNLSKHFSFVSELSVRSAQFWYENSYFVSTSQPYTFEPDGYFVPYTDKFFDLYLPIAFGMRYRF